MSEKKNDSDGSLWPLFWLGTAVLLFLDGWMEDLFALIREPVK